MSPIIKHLLVFKHMPSQNPGIFRQYAKEFGVKFHEIDLHAGDMIPDIFEYDGVWAMGGSMNVWEEDQYPWLVEEKNFIREIVEEKVPYLGICFGHQLLADALGGTVNPTDNHELGVFSIAPTEAGINHPFLHDLPETPGWTNVHTAEVTTAPAEAVVLARSERCPNHAMAVGENAYSVQFHPEVCESTVSDWLEIPDIIPFFTDTLGEAGFESFKSNIENARPKHNLAAKQLLENWLKLVF